MKNKHTKLIFLILTLLVVATMLGMVACADKRKTEPEDDDPPYTEPQKEMQFGEYMNKINSGMLNSEKYLKNIYDYHVKSTYDIYSSVENYTLTYEAVYNKSSRESLYYLSMFDNANHIERINVLYDGADLYVTAKESHYKIENFSSLLIFDMFYQIIEKLDIKDLVYNKYIRDYFTETSALSQVFGVKDCSYTKVSDTRETISIANGDLSILMSRINARIKNATEDIGTTFDAASMHYLGFRLSKLFELSFNTIMVEEIRFLLGDGRIDETSVLVDGRMQDNTKYFIKAQYGYDEKTKTIEQVKTIPEKYAYEKINLGKGSYDGKVMLPEIRDSEFDVSFDYNLNGYDNEKNEFTFRIYDQLNTMSAIRPGEKYVDIKELCSVYYKDEILYLNTTGLYDYVNTGVALSMLNLPKTYVTDIDVSNLLSLTYSRFLQVAFAFLSPSDRENNPISKELYKDILFATTSDVENQEISIEITEELIKAFRGDDTDLSIVIDRMLKLEEGTLNQYFGANFFALLKGLVSYNFGTKILGIEIVYDQTTVAEFEMARVDYYGVMTPNDLNELIYSEFRKPERITSQYEIQLRPYGAENVDLSKFFGAMIGDPTGKNTPYSITLNEYIAVRGKISEYYTTINGESRPVTTYDLDFYQVTGEGKTATETLLMSLAVNPANTDEMLVESYIGMGDYSGTEKLSYRIKRKAVNSSLESIAEDGGIFASQTSTAALLKLFSATGDSSKLYSENGYFCISMMATQGKPATDTTEAEEGKDPVKELIGIENATAIVKVKFGFDILDLSNIDLTAYTDPYINSIEGITAESIYSSGSRWKETVPVYIGTHLIDMKLSYEEESVKIKTGTSVYNPTAYLFGKEITYTLTILNENGTRKISGLNLENNLLVIDPAFMKTLPEKIAVRYDNSDTGEIEFVVDESKAFNDQNITTRGYNMALLDKSDATRFENTDYLYTIHIGQNSIAQITLQMYISVINREIIPIEKANGEGDYTVYGSYSVPVIAQFTVDPYTYAMKKRVGGKNEDYDIVKDLLETNRTRLDFENLYGYKKEINDKTQIEEDVPCYYNVQGYNWFNVSDVDMHWEFETSEITWEGGIAYAYGYYGDKEKGNYVPAAVRLLISKKEVSHVQIDSCAQGTYLIDYLIKATYDVPVTSDMFHTVRIYFEDGTYRTVTRTISQSVSESKFNSEYIYGELAWKDIEVVKSKISVTGTGSIFGTEGKMTDTTRAEVFVLGGEHILSSQIVPIRIVIPSRDLSLGDLTSKGMIIRYDEEDDYAPVRGSVSLNKAYFFEPENKNDGTFVPEPFVFEPYNASKVLPDTIWLYVKQDWGQKAISRWQEYPVQWVTTDDTGRELNLIAANSSGKYVLAHPVTEERDLVVYAKVGDGDNGGIWVVMYVKNQASEIKEWHLYLPDGTEFNLNTAVQIDPYLSYVDRLPDAYVAVLETGAEVTNIDANGNHGRIKWFVTEDGIKYPIFREDDFDFMAAKYNARYGEDGYYIFSRNGSEGTLPLEMKLVAGGEEGDIGTMTATQTINASVQVRSVKYTKDDGGQKVSDYVDIFDRGFKDGEKYYAIGNITGGVGTAKGGFLVENAVSAGYLEINFYVEDSQILLDELLKIRNNGGIGYCGLLLNEIKNETVGEGMNTALSEVLYAKKVNWYSTGTETLDNIINALRKQDERREFRLYGDVDEDNRNRLTIEVKFTIFEQTLASLEMKNSGEMTGDGVYTIKNDTNSNGVLTIAELNVLTKAGFVAQDGYKKYFNSTSGYTGNASDSSGNGFKYVIYFRVDQPFSLSKNVDRTYTSPYEYYQFLFDSLELTFTSGITRSTKGVFTTGAREASFFNKSVLGAETSTLYNGNTASYSFLILEKFSLGSALDRTLVIIDADRAMRITNANTITENGFNSELKEIYNTDAGYMLPIIAEIQYKRISDEKVYTVKYNVDGWLPDSESASALGTNKIKAIPKTNINVRDGVQYRFIFDIPDVGGGSFYQAIGFTRTDASLGAFVGQSKYEMYTIRATGTEGVITIDNAYTFFFRNGKDEAGNDVYTFNTELIPIDLFNLFSRSDTVNMYTVKWTWTKLNFDETIYTVGTSLEEDNKIKIAEFIFGSYYAGGQHIYQTLNLYVRVEPMEFYGIEKAGLTIMSNGGDNGENAVLNTIQIDPYKFKDSSGDSGRFTLPTTITVLFNGGTQRYTFKNSVKYRLMGFNEIKFIGFNEKGHTLVDQGVKDPSFAEVNMYIPGYSVNGIELIVRFLERKISNAQIENKKYNADGTYVYETNSKGEIVYVDKEPQIATYKPLVSYKRTIPGILKDDVTEGMLPIYYIDPYNTATYELPRKGTFEFVTEPGVYGEYDITGWQYYDEEKQTFVTFERVDNAIDAKSMRFYQMRRIGATGSGYNACYYNPSANNYQGGQQLLRGYITVGGSSQYFEVLLVILNRTLRSGVTLGNPEFSVYYDYDDPIAAMLQDIPNAIGEIAFVNFDMYYKKFSYRSDLKTLDGEKEVITERYYEFSVAEEDYYSFGGTNNPANPGILWNEGVDTDGDGVYDADFSTFTTTGYNGNINGYVYFKAGNLSAKLDYYEKLYGEAYTTLAKALIWDELGSSIPIANAGAKEAIEKQKVIYEKALINETFDITLSNLDSDELIQYMGTTLIEDFREKAEPPQGDYDLDDPEQEREYNEAYKKNIVPLIYENVSQEYESWKASNMKETTGKVDVYLLWAETIKEYTSLGVKDSSDISANQKMKAERINALLADDAFGMNNEVNAIIASKKKDLFIEINADIWRSLFVDVNIYETDRMEEILEQRNTVLGEKVWYSSSLEMLSAELNDYDDLGIKGEEAEAHITVPVITYDGMETKEVIFNKFNFDSIEAEFTVKFKLSYKNIYEEKLDDARIESAETETEANAREIINDYIEKKTQDAIDSIAPKISVEGNIQTIPGMIIGGEAFGYEWWKKNKDNASTPTTYYGNLWNNLYNYSIEEALYYVISNVPGVSDFASLYSLKNSSQLIDAWEDILIIFDYLQGLETYLYESKASEIREMSDLEKVAYTKYRNIYAVARALDDAYKATLENSYANNMNTCQKTILALSTYIVSGIEVVTRGKNKEINWGDALKNYGETIRSDADENALPQHERLAELIVCVRETETDFYAELAPKLLLAEDEGVQKAMQVLMDSTAPAAIVNGAARMFGLAYGESGYYLSRNVTIPQLVKSALDTIYTYVLTDENGNPILDAYGNEQLEYTNEVYNILCTGYSDPSEIVYRSLKNSVNPDGGGTELMETASLIFDYLCGYVASKKSPYDYMRENIGTLSAFNLNAEFFEEFDANGNLKKDCLLNYATPDTKILDAILKLAEENPVVWVGAQGSKEDAEWKNEAKKKAELQLKRMIMFESVSDLSTGTDYTKTIQWKNEALFDLRVEATEKAFDALKKGGTSAVKAANELAKGLNKDVRSFSMLIERRLTEKEIAQSACDLYIDEYIKENAYRKSFDILDGLYKELTKSTPNGTVLKYFGRYLENKGYATIDNSADDGYPVNTDETNYDESVEFLDLMGKEIFGDAYNEYLRNGYMKDYLLMAYVEYYENDADEKQREIIGEIMNYYTGYQISTIGEHNFRDAVVAYLKNKKAIVPVLGKIIYNGLESRKDMGLKYTVDIYDRYYEVYLNMMLKGAEYMISRKSDDEIKLSVQYNDILMKYEDLTEDISGLMIDWSIEEGNEEELMLEIKACLIEIAIFETKKMIFEKEAKNNSGSYNTQYQAAMEAIEGLAYSYAYEQMYNEIDSEGNYVYRDDIDEVILKNIEEYGMTEASNKQIFELVGDALIAERTDLLYDAVEESIRIKLYESIYDEIKLLALSADGFVAKIFDFLYNRMSVNGKNIYFNFGNEAVPETNEKKTAHIMNLINSLSGGISSANAELFTILTDWWKSPDKSVYGEMSAVEINLLESVYLQCSYQAKLSASDIAEIDNNATLTDEQKQQKKDDLRNRVALLTMINNLYRFLNDIDSYIYGELDGEEGMPLDYFGEENESEKKSFVIRGMIEGTLMIQSGHSISLAQSNFIDELPRLIQSKTVSVINAVGDNASIVLNDIGDEYEKQVAYILKAVTEKEISSKATDADKREFNDYLKIAKKYISFTAIGINGIYLEGIEKNASNPVRYYVNEIHKIVLGKDLSGAVYRKTKENGTAYTNEELRAMFGMLPLRCYVDETIADEGTRYKNALDKMVEDRDITVKFCSEDFYEATGDGTDRRVIYFDRTIWEEFEKNTDPDKGVAKNDITNCVIELGNPYKMDSKLPGHSFTADDITFKLGDLSKVEVLFGGETEYNTITIDALKPDLPDTVQARGYVDETTYINLGTIPIKEYSEAFYQLIYTDAEFIDEDANAYVITIDATSNITVNIRINVKYKDRSIKEIYLTDNKYMEYEGGPNNKDKEFGYTLYKEMSEEERLNKIRKENVMYIDPTKAEIINADYNGYLLPTTIGVRCGTETNIMKFTDVEWEFGTSGKLAYTLSGTQGYLNDVRLSAYRYTDEVGDERYIRYNYKTKDIEMSVYDGTTGKLKSHKKYALAESSQNMIDWNISVFALDKSVTKITLPNDSGDVDTEELLGENVDGVIDATTGTLRINPYYPEYPSQIKLHLTGGDMVTLNLANSDWTLYEGTALDNIALGVEENLEFYVRIQYRGYSIRIKMLAMDIKLPSKALGSYFNGGTIYIAKGQDTTEMQLKKNYSLMYYNFGDEETPNWQKVNILFSTAAYDIISTKESENKGIYGAMGVATPGAINNNIEFTIKVVDLAAYAMLSENSNRYVQYNYMSVPTDVTGTEKYSGQDEPDTIGDYFSLIKKDGTVVNFIMDKENITYDFEVGNKRVIIPSKYNVDDDEVGADPKVGFDASGSRYRVIRVEIPMKDYKYTSVPEKPEFNTDETGKKWTWTTVNKLSSEYVDAIHWPLGKTMKSEDLPTIFDSEGNEVYLKWDLTDLNVNKANIVTPGAITSDDGTVIVGYYLSETGGLWKSIELKVYIDKKDVTNSLIGTVADAISKRGISVNGRYINKTYDGKFFDIGFDPNSIAFTREDGSVVPLPAEAYSVEYMSEDDERRVWSDSNYPLDAGIYYVRIRFEDYNVYVNTEEEWLMKLTVVKRTVNLDALKFNNESDNGIITYVYTGEKREYYVVDGLPEIEVDRWFEPGEKAALFTKYFAELNDETKAAAAVYDEIRARVSYGVRAIMDGWYNEVRVNQGFSDPEMIKAYIYNNDDYMPATKKTVIEVGVKVTFKDEDGNTVISPEDVGTYYAEVVLDNLDPDFISKNYVAVTGSQKTFTVIVIRDDDLVYQIESETLTYTGRAQNPRISGLHNSAGSIPAGVTIKYVYTFGTNRLVVENKNNEYSINAEETNYNATLMGIKDVGEYQCTISILGGDNFRSADIPTTTISIRKANVFISIDDIVKAYLDDVEYLGDHVRIYSDDFPNGSTNTGDNNNDKLLAGDKLSVLGYLDLETPVQSHFELGTYYTYINGFKKSDSDVLTYTYITEIEREILNDVFESGDEYRLLKLKGATMEGNLYKYGTEYQSIIDAFANYNIYIKTTLYSGMSTDDRGAAGRYTIDIVTGVDGTLDYTNVYIVGNKIDLSDPVVKYVDANTNALKDIMASIKDGDTVMIYLSAIKDVYALAELNADATVEICGYYQNETYEDEDGNEVKIIGTKIGGIVMNKGSVSVKIVSVIVGANQTGIYLNDNAGSFRMENSEIICSEKTNTNTVGIYVSVNYSKSIYLNKSLIKGLIAGVEVNSSSCLLGVDKSVFRSNYFGVSIAEASKGINIMETEFMENEYGVYSESSEILLLYCVFSYNRTGLYLPKITNEDMRTTNEFDTTNNVNTVESEEE